MYRLHINGQIYETETDKKLIRYLRDDLRLTSVKDGCSEGACGTCTVIVDGKATRACIPTVSKMEGKKILTVEGLSQREKDVYGYAFAKAGAVQCGFCIPGMVMCAKALLDANPAPDRMEVIVAIRNNVCRWRKSRERFLWEWPCRGSTHEKRCWGRGNTRTTSIWMA